MDALDRKFLREQALKSWEEAKRLRLEATILGLKTVEAGRHGAESLARHKALVEGFPSPPGRGSQTSAPQEEAAQRTGHISEEAAMVLARSSGSTFFEDLVDHAIDLKSEIFAEVAIGGHIALVGSGDPDMLIRIKQLVGTVIPYTLGVMDAATALGVAIAIQPDLAIIDSTLELANGTEVTLTFPLYAPRTKALVLTDDPENALDLRLAGFDSNPRSVSDSELVAWTANAMAEVGR